MENLLVVITARGGSKGLPGKNIKKLCGKPLICYSIDAARAITTDDNICVSTEDPKIIETVENYGLKVPFVRPAEYATDTATSNDVLLHAVSYYESIGRHYDKQAPKVTILYQDGRPQRLHEQLNRQSTAFASYWDIKGWAEYMGGIDIVNKTKDSYIDAFRKEID